MTRIAFLSAILVLVPLNARSQPAETHDSLAAGQNFERFIQIIPLPEPGFKNPSNVQFGQKALDPSAKTPNIVLIAPPARPSTCSVPLLRVTPSPHETFPIKRVPAPAIDQAMVIKPRAPSCDETSWGLRPGIVPPQIPSHH